LHDGVGVERLAAVAGVDLTVNAGDVYGYLGPNGAGKTTSLRMMLGLIRPTAKGGKREKMLKEGSY